MENEFLGKIAYDAYCKAVGGVSIREEKLPTFENQSEILRNAWTIAAVAVADTIDADSNSDF